MPWAKRFECDFCEKKTLIQRIKCAIRRLWKA